MDALRRKYNYVIHDLADPRTQDWWGVSNPLVVFSIASAYLYFCKSLGPRLMENRKPFQLKTVLLLYNIFQVGFSLFLAKEALISMTHKDFNLACEPIDFSTTPKALQFATTVWFYYIAKFTELMDTIFFVLRKKYNQVSFLHVYHHTIMTFGCWLTIKYYPGGHLILMGFLNAIVHVVMYTYYLISSFGPEYQKYVWWKRYLTEMQLIQFAIVFVHHCVALFSDCEFSKTANILFCLNAVVFMYMFGRFYLKSYKKKSKA
ncbi:unnamed protein product [Arctia plantaginis]|uniref:Elongation of very long chain fatty acids protein n=1 Tax=Arctia plantaginis TaxID=874455 RepID=A0A8S0Z6Z6_ARCPL|nr:unnamed protein product [Arctia plantaginis]